MKILVTGGAGFIGSAVCRHMVRDLGRTVINVDKLTYASSLGALASLDQDARHVFIKADICDRPAMLQIMRVHKVDAIMHLAAESHVDRSIDGPAAFVETNVVGTYQLLEAAREYYQALTPARQARFRFHHVSTDEVFGDLPFDGTLFDERSVYRPSSPYSASKAASDHFVRAWKKTYGLPVVISNCSNNYGPFQFPEKLIPLTIINALEGERLAVYGDGQNVRDWLHVEDHARALSRIVIEGRPGETYLVGGHSERSNLSVVEAICNMIDDKLGPADGGPRRRLIEFVVDRPGHDRRYAIDPSKFEAEFGWRAERTFEEGLSRTIDWYIDNRAWWEPIRRKRYRGARLGKPDSRPLAHAGEPAPQATG